MFELATQPGPGDSQAFEDIFPELKLPGDEGWAAHMFDMHRRLAATLSRQGWKFIKKDGPRGIYFDGHGPGGKRIMSDQRREEAEAVLVAIRHAARM